MQHQLSELAAGELLGESYKVHVQFFLLQPDGAAL